MVSGEGNWKKVAQSLNDRTHLQCLHRWQKVLNPALVKGPWKEEVCIYICISYLSSFTFNLPPPSNRLTALHHITLRYITLLSPRLLPSPLFMYTSFRPTKCLKSANCFALPSFSKLSNFAVSAMILSIVQVSYLFY